MKGKTVLFMKKVYYLGKLIILTIGFVTEYFFINASFQFYENGCILIIHFNNSLIFIHFNNSSVKRIAKIMLFLSIQIFH